MFQQTDALNPTGRAIFALEDELASLSQTERKAAARTPADVLLLTVTWYERSDILYHGKNGFTVTRCTLEKHLLAEAGRSGRLTLTVL